MYQTRVKSATDADVLVIGAVITGASTARELSQLMVPFPWPDRRAAGDFTTAKVIISACRPYHRMKDFLRVHTATEEQRQAVMKKWPELFGKY